MKCQRCGLPQFDGAAGYAGPQCKCWPFFNPGPQRPYSPPDGCRPFVPLTEADVRRIVREELQRAGAPDAQKETPWMRVPLTDDQIDQITAQQWGRWLGAPYAAYRAYARAIEAAHGIGTPAKEAP